MASTLLIHVHAVSAWAGRVQVLDAVKAHRLLSVQLLDSDASELQTWSKCNSAAHVVHVTSLLVRSISSIVLRQLRSLTDLSHHDNSGNKEAHMRMSGMGSQSSTMPFQPLPMLASAFSEVMHCA